MSQIPKSESFTALLATRPRARTRRLQRFVIPNAQAGQRIGALVPKRWAKRAVDRSLLKRLFREAHRQWADPDLPHADTLVRLVARVDGITDTDRELWWEELRQLFNTLPKR